MVVPKYRIRLLDGEEVEIQPTQSVKDYGVGLAVVATCVCRCGDSHEKTVRFIPRVELAEAVVIADGMSMRI